MSAAPSHPGSCARFKNSALSDNHPRTGRPSRGNAMNNTDAHTYCTAGLRRDRFHFHNTGKALASCCASYSYNPIKAAQSSRHNRDFGDIVLLSLCFGSSVPGAESALYKPASPTRADLQRMAIVAAARLARIRSVLDGLMQEKASHSSATNGH